jgi:hypothetical protein
MACEVAAGLPAVASLSILSVRERKTRSVSEGAVRCCRDVAQLRVQVPVGHAAFATLSC